MRKRSSLVTLLLFAASLLEAQWRVDTVAGIYPLGNDGPATNALLGRPRHLAFDRAGNLYIADTDNHQIRRLDRDGRIIAVAGNGAVGDSGDGGPALSASLNQPRAVALDGNRLYIADSGNFRIRVMNLETGVIEHYAGTDDPKSSARLGSIRSIIMDPKGNLLVLDGRIPRRIDRQSGIITPIYREFGIATGSSTLPPSNPEGMAIEADGTLYFAGSYAIVRVDPSGQRDYYPSSSGGPIVAPVGLALDPVKRILYFTDSYQCMVYSLALETRIFREVAVG